MSKSNILFQLSGSIACFKACSLISRLVQEGHEVQTVATTNALKFIGEATLEGLTGRPVFTDTFQNGRMMDHIHLAKWADLAIACPATADLINRLAAGSAGDCVGSLFLAFDLKKPYLIAPAMNQEMMKHPATQAAVAKLRSWNVKILETQVGHQACGDIGPGRMLEPEQLHAEISRYLGGNNR